MKFKPSIRQAVSQVFDILIPQDKWNDYMTMLDRDGHPNRRELVALVLVFGKHIEQLEQAVEELTSTGFDPAKPQTEEIKLRTPNSVKIDLDTLLKPETKVFYLSTDDWKILESVSGSVYGKEVDPKDGQEKTVIYYQDRPVFKK